MAHLDDLTAQYLVGAADGPPMPDQFDNCLVKPLVDAVNYNASLIDALSIVGTGATPAANAGHFILIHNWWLGLKGGQYEGGNPGSGGGFQVVDGQPYFLDGPLRVVPTPGGGTDPLFDRLIAKAKLGVDVRIMGWVLTGISSNILSELGGSKAFGGINSATLQAIKALRDEPTISMKAIVDDIAHPGGAAHTKMCVIGNPSRAIAFTGGIDFDNLRWAQLFHKPGSNWHDVMARIEGPGVKGVYEWFRSIWEEVRVRAPHVVGGVGKGSTPIKTAQKYRINNVTLLGHGVGTDPEPTPALAAYSVPDPSPAVGVHRVQNLRTVPQFNFALFNILPSPDPISFAKDGLFEFRQGLKKAISGARQYIYMEDQSFWSREIMGWIHDAIVANSDLKVIFLSGAADPTDPVFPPGFLANALNIGLLQGGDPKGASLTADQKARVHFFSRLDDTLFGEATIRNVTPSGANFVLTFVDTANGDIAANALVSNDGQVVIGTNVFPVVANPALAFGDPLTMTVSADTINAAAPVSPTPNNCDIVVMRRITVHSKVTLIDDNCAVIGSANAMRRSLYTDLENSILFVDPNDTAVRDFRAQLWADHFIQDDPTIFNDLQASLHGWDAQWGTAGAIPRRPSHIILRPLPVVAAPLTPNQQDVYDSYDDTDSLDSWGGLCPVIPAGSSLSK